MAYYLGVDLGTTYTAAAVCRGGRVDISSLGTRAPAMPSVILIREDGEVLVGDAAERRSVAEPHRVAREFKRRIGDPTPLIVGGTPMSAAALTAKLLRSVVTRVAETEGAPPDGVAVSHPANWGNFKKDLLVEAVRLADLDDVAFVTEPEAAAINYANQERIEPGAVVAVYDLGGGTFDAAVLRRSETGWDVLGEPEGIERLGGIDLDEAVFRHVATTLGDPFTALDPDDEAVQTGVTRLRQDCIVAKEGLSEDTDATIPVMLPGIQQDVRITRGEFEDMVRPALADSITALHRALRSAQVEPDQLGSVLLVGGSSRVPLVGQMVMAEIGRPLAVDAHPKFGIASGAALVAAQHGSSGSPSGSVQPAAGAGRAAADQAERSGPGAGTIAAAAAGGAALGAGAAAFASDRDAPGTPGGTGGTGDPTGSGDGLPAQPAAHGGGRPVDEPPGHHSTQHMVVPPPSPPSPSKSSPESSLSPSTSQARRQPPSPPASQQRVHVPAPQPAPPPRQPQPAPRSQPYPQQAAPPRYDPQPSRPGAGSQGRAGARPSGGRSADGPPRPAPAPRRSGGSSASTWLAVLIVAAVAFGIFWFLLRDIDWPDLGLGDDNDGGTDTTEPVDNSPTGQEEQPDLGDGGGTVEHPTDTEPQADTGVEEDTTSEPEEEGADLEDPAATGGAGE